MTDNSVSPEKTCQITIRVRYCEVDQQKAVHHSRYAVYFEMGRTELLRQSGNDYKTLEETGVMLVIAKMETRFRYPARYDQELILTTTQSHVDRVKLEHTYTLKCAKTGKVIADAKTTLVHVDQKGNLKALPDFLTK